MLKMFLFSLFRFYVKSVSMKFFLFRLKFHFWGTKTFTKRETLILSSVYIVGYCYALYINGSGFHMLIIVIQ